MKRNVCRVLMPFIYSIAFAAACSKNGSNKDLSEGSGMKEGIVRVVVSDASNLPVKDARITIEHTVWYNSYLFTASDQEGKYQAPLPNGLWFVMPLHMAIEYVNECKKRAYRNIGIDGFYLHNPGIQPSMEDGVDFSSHTYKFKLDMYSDAIEFLNARPKSTFFEIVCKDME